MHTHQVIDILVQIQSEKHLNTNEKWLRTVLDIFNKFVKYRFLSCTIFFFFYVLIEI